MVSHLLHETGVVRRPRWSPAAAVHRLPSGAREFLLLGLLYLTYTASRLASPAPADAAQRNGHRVIDLERFLHLDPEHTLNDALYNAPRWLGVAASYFYETMHYAVTVVTLVWLYRGGKALYRGARNWLVAMTFPALLSFWLFPVAPPRSVPGAVAHDIIAENHQYGWWGAGGGTAPSGLSSLVNENAAMPSLHVGWAIWVGWNLSHHATNRVVRASGLVYPFVTIVVVLSTGNHYLLDVIGGALLAVAGTVLVDHVLPRTREPRVPSVTTLPARAWHTHTTGVVRRPRTRSRSAVPAAVGDARRAVRPSPGRGAGHRSR